MKQIVPIISIVFLLAAPVAALQAQSLAEAAQKEKERREGISQNPQEITNDQMGKFSGGAVSTNTVPPPAPGEGNASEPDSQEKAGETGVAAKEKEAKEQNGDSDEPTDFEGRTESYWRTTMTEARTKVKNLENEATALTLKMNDLENKFYNIDDGFDRDAVQKEIQKTYYEIDLNKENLAKAKDELEALELDAQKSGALPGWIQ
jgi:hypothetical protein